MPVKFKVSAAAPEASVDRVLAALRARGFVAERMFPAQKRAALARMFIIRSRGVQAAEVEKVLAPFGNVVEYVEGTVRRKTAGLGTDPP